MSDYPKFSGASRVEQLIEKVMDQFPGHSTYARNAYFDAVHQELAPLARELERENEILRKEVTRLMRREKNL